MKITKSRWVLVGVLAFGVLGAIGGFTPDVATADPAPSVSPFAGTYDWSVWPIPISIAGDGRITSSYSGGGGSKDSISGRVSADGSYSFTRTETVYLGGYFPHGHVPREESVTVRSKYAGAMTTDVDGNIIGTADTGGSFVWFQR